MCGSLTQSLSTSPWRRGGGGKRGERRRRRRRDSKRRRIQRERGEESREGGEVGKWREGSRQGRVKTRNKEGGWESFNSREFDFGRGLLNLPAGCPEK